MSRTADEIRASTDAMRDELAPMTRSAALGWGKRRIHGAALDQLLAGIAHAPDGSTDNATAGAEVLGAWAEHVVVYAQIIRDKPADPPRTVPLKKR